MEVINYVKTYLRIDERRIYLTGLSLGGGGAWVAAQDYPELFAAIAPVCGGYNSTSRACGIASENLPVWAFHGDIDGVVPMSRTVNMVNAINACTPTPSPLAKLTIYPGVGHSAWNNAYKTDNSVHNPNLYQWIQSFTNTTNKGNKIPVANAGSDKTVSLMSTTLTGSGTDTDGTIATYAWTQISGPSAAALINSTTNVLTASSLIIGTYVFRLRVTDNSGNTDSDYIKLSVTAPNILPVANAGADKTITLPANSVTITGSGTDADGTIASYAWTKVSGGAATLSGTATTTLSVSGLVQGAYVFRLTVTDNKGGSKSDDMRVTVNASAGTTINKDPIVSAGSDKTITLPTKAITLVGTASDPDGTIASYQWTQISGIAAPMMNTTTRKLWAYNLKVGTYVFRLTVKDNNDATKYDEVTLTVKDVVVSTTSFRIQTASDTEIASASGLTGSDEQYAGLGNLTSAQLENSTVVIFNGEGEKIFTGAWGPESYREVMTGKGLYMYNVIREGRRTDTGKIYIRN
jgi:hypothetical protein